ncbi:MAG: DNA-3-methyladenine glycosylase [Nitrososphaerales archaeon]|jgi:DNA-3-methyladenine glycosylase
MTRLTRRFFDEYTPSVARALLGTVLVRVVDGKRLSGTIVETEAYRGARDPASHAYSGRTKRNAVMFGEGGHAYVYFSYGFHWCLNLTTEPAGRAGAVLVRAVEPIEGLEQMLRTRNLDSDEHVADGPGKLTQALGIDSTLNGEDLITSDRLFVEEGKKVEETGSSSRVGIRQGVAFRWRFFIKGNRFVSKARPSTLHTTHN